MPVLDHFHPPLSNERFYSSFPHTWSASIARYLNRYLLPDGFFAVPNLQFGARVEMDVATFDEGRSTGSAGDMAVHVAPPPTVVAPFSFPDTVEVRIFSQEGGPVAAIELVSPSNKDRIDHRLAFTAKMANYLHQGIALAVVDIVTKRKFHLHNEWADRFSVAGARLADSDEKPLYANAYRPVQRDDRAELEMWLHSLCLGDPLPTLPLYVRADLAMQVPLEETYLEACEDQRIQAR